MTRLGRGLERLSLRDCLIVGLASILLGYGGHRLARDVHPAMLAAAAVAYAVLALWCAGTEQDPPQALADLGQALDFTYAMTFRCGQCEHPFVVDARLQRCVAVTCDHMAAGLQRPAQVRATGENHDGAVTYRVHWGTGRPDAA